MSRHGVLGVSTSYPQTYDATVLYPIPRAIGREHIAWPAVKLAIGVDWWQAFEVSWLNPQGISQVATARISVPANSPNIIESKSLKLYLNSLNLSEFASWQAVEDTITADLSNCVGMAITVQLFDLMAQPLEPSFLIQDLPGECIDTALDDRTTKLELVAHPDARLLSSVREDIASEGQDIEQSHQLYCNLLRSNCPVTNQPDWGSVAIAMSTQISVNKANLLAYILSYRQHNGFHEQCVEQIFADISQYFKPSKLMVRAWYTRRGGIDINPCRVSDLALLPKPSRLVRQ